MIDAVDGQDGEDFADAQQIGHFFQLGIGPEDGRRLQAELRRDALYRIPGLDGVGDDRFTRAVGDGGMGAGLPDDDGAPTGAGAMHNDPTGRLGERRGGESGLLGLRGGPAGAIGGEMAQPGDEEEHEGEGKVGGPAPDERTLAPAVAVPMPDPCRQNSDGVDPPASTPPLCLLNLSRLHHGS